MNIVSPQQEIKVKGQVVSVTKKDVRNLHISVMPPTGKVRVTAPKNMTAEAIRLAVVSRLSWIEQQQQKFLKQDRQTIRKYVSGESHYYLGRPLRLKITSTEKKSSVYLKGKNSLVIEIKENATRTYKEYLLTKWYRKELNLILKSLLPKVEKSIKIKPTKIGIRHMKTRWGSCNQNKKIIWLNLELIKKPTNSIEFVLVHEYCHMIEKKHNDKFLRLMDTHLPKWRLYKDELNRMPLSYEKWNY